MTQLALELKLSDSAVFDNFVAGDNAPALAAARTHAECPRHPVLWLHGPEGSGKSHLLQAACAAAVANKRSVAYVPLSEWQALDPAILCGLETRALVCLDDIERIAGNAVWETAIFALFNALRDNGGVLFVSALSGAPRRTGFALADLESRLASGPVFALKALDDQTRIAALKVRATSRGLVLPDDVALYLLRHHRRDMGTLYGLLDKLDDASLAAKRRLTLPFARAVLRPPET